MEIEVVLKCIFNRPRFIPPNFEGKKKLKTSLPAPKSRDCN